MSNTTNPNSGKDVIYIDVDDEITAIIDKVRSSSQRIVALVLPKRATVMQSIVNMKLLKRTADGAKKHIVLITAEAGLLPLAGTVGIHVAKSLQSRPEIPAVPAGAHPDGDDDDRTVPVTLGAAAAGTAVSQLDKSRPIGEYTGAAAHPTGAADEESIQMDDDELPADKPGASTPPKLKKDRKLMIPDFNKFRLLLILGGVGLVLLIIGGYFALAVMPKAAVTVKTDSSAIDTSMDVTLAGIDTDTDLDQAILPAKQQKVEKTASQTVAATGSVNKGERAKGSITITNCNFNSITIAAGTGFSADGLTFISQKSVTVPKSNYDFMGNGGFKCKNDGKASVDVLAQKAGANYNLATREYTIATSSENVKAVGTAMEGGTDNVVKIVLQADIDAAKDKITTQENDALEFELEEALLADGLFAISDTLVATPTPEVTTSVPVGSEATEVTVTQKTAYTMLGVKQNDIKKLIAAQVKQKIDTKRQSILDYGIDDAVFEVLSNDPDKTRVSMRVTSITGSDLNLNEIKNQIAGKKASDAKDLIEQYPGVTQVTVKYSPFWVSSIPKKTSKITLTVEKPQVKNADN